MVDVLHYILISITFTILMLLFYHLYLRKKFARIPKTLYIVTVDSWNGTSSSFYVHSVHTVEEKAKRVCRANNKPNGSTYAPVYSYEMADLEEG